MTAISTKIIPNNTPKLIEQLDSLFDFEKELDEMKPCLLPLRRATRSAEYGISDLGARLIQRTTAYSPEYTTMPRVITHPCKAASPMRSSVLQEIKCGKIAPTLSDAGENVLSYPRNGYPNPPLLQDDKMVYCPLAQPKETEDSQALNSKLNIFSFLYRPWRCLGG